MIVVKFRDGNYGVRRGWGGWFKPSFEFLSIGGAWYKNLVDIQNYCRFTTYAEADQQLKALEFKNIPDYGEPTGDYAVDERDYY